MRLTLRRATATDAAALAALSRDTFTDTFGALYTQTDLMQFLESTYTADNYALLLEEQGCAAWVVEDAQGQLHGYALAGPCHLPHVDVAPGDMELKRLYMRAALQNGGWGRRLWDAALAWMQANGPTALWLGVYSENTGAQRFYERLGFQKVGEYQFVVGTARDREFILRRGNELQEGA